MRPAAIALPALSILFLACGGPSGSAPAPQGDAQGLYTGTIVSRTAGNLTATVAISPAGEMRYVASNNMLAVAQVPTRSGKVYEGTLGLVSSMSVSGLTIRPGIGLSGSYTMSAGDSGTFNFTYTPLYERPRTIASLAGTYIAAVTTSGYGSRFTVDAVGNLSGQDSDGTTYTGRVTLPDPSRNLFGVTIAYATGRTFSGLAFWSDAAAGLTPDALYFQLSGVNNTYAVGGVFVKSQNP